MLVVKEEDSSAGGRGVVEKSEEGGVGGPPRLGSGVTLPNRESSRGSQRRARLRWVIAMREAIRRVQAWKTAGSRKNRSLRKICIEVSWRISSARSAPAKRVM